MRANLAALDVVQRLDEAGRGATSDEQAVLARWSGWGAVPEVFDERRDDFADQRAQLASRLTRHDYAAAASSTLNAHYTDADLVTAIWAGVAELGFGGGAVLEPGCGSGNFIAFAPAGAAMVGIEREPTTAAIARALYPNAQVLTESIADTRAGEGSFDLAIGNVPFGNVVLSDPRHNRAGHSIHNHALVKSLHLVRPGGLVAALTSRYTMDARNPAARRELAELGDLVGAVRLPGGAHGRAAGTSVVTDLLILRRRAPDQAPPDESGWERARQVDLSDAQVTVNEYFLDRPDAVLGQLTAGRGVYGRDELLVRATGAQPVATQLTGALDRIAETAHRDGLVMTPPAGPAPQPGPVALVSARSERREGYLAAGGDATFTRVEDGREVTHTVPGTQAAELRRLLGLRDTVVALLEAEAGTGDDTAEIDELRATLGRRYDGYTAAHGPLNRFSWRRTGRVDAETGEEKMARVRPPQGRFRLDPYAPAVYALEHFDPATQQAAKADIFRQRVVAPRARRLGADSPDDALAICLDTHGEVHLSEVARLLGADETTARTQLGTHVFDDPAEDRLVPAAEYLSGNVRAKLAAAQAAAEADDRYNPNVDALTEVIPPDLAPEQIDGALGAAWVAPGYVQQFLRETLDDPNIAVENPTGVTWSVRGARSTVAATETWGTQRAPAPHLAQATLEQRRITVHDEIGDGADKKRVLNLQETVAAQEKAEALDARFSEWLWEDDQRAAELAATYNERFNALVLRNYDDAALSLPGLAVTFQPRPHQVAAVARMIHEPAVGLYHEVGAGKTAEMAMGCMELRRLGMVTKPAVVVPNNMLDQFAREWQQLYPQARLLIATRDDLTRDRRRAFVARCATGNWDAVVMTRSAFSGLEMSPAHQRDYLDRELEQLREAIERSKEGQGLTVKRLERSLLAAQERIKTKLDRAARDPGMTFEQTGLDYLVIDEAHAYKNLRTASNIASLSVEGSDRAQDLHMKLEYLRSRRGDRVATFATATPIANSVTEAHVMQRYLRPDLLEAAGLPDFDTWAATFATTTTQLELAPDGGSFRMQTRVAKFVNVPELLRMWHVSADVRTAEDLQLPCPRLVARRGDGQRAPETVIVEPSPELSAYVDDLGQRAEAIRAKAVQPDEDNMLKVTGDGRRAALDLRLVDIDTAEPGKVEAVADRVAALYAEHRHDVYRRPDGSDHPTPGSLQLVFCDLGTPRDGWNVYDELRDQLVARGVAAEGIRYVHEAKTDQAKGELFAACREGQVAVLIGSTERMGMGTNVQARAAALHHVDCPWRPADLHQRDGRILRQGNRHDEVAILRYATEGSFDAYMWQTVERKAKFISQVTRGRLDVREIEDIGDSALSYSEAKALATGDPRVMEKAQLDAEVTKLERLQRAHDRSQERLTNTARHHAAHAAQLDRDADAVDAAIGARRSTRGDAFAATIGGARLTSRAEAGDRLKTLAEHELLRDRAPRPDHPTELAHLGGLTVIAVAQRGYDGPEIRLGFSDVPGIDVRLGLPELRTSTPTGLVSRLEYRLANLERQRDDYRADAQRLRDEAGRATEQLGTPFGQSTQLAQARTRARELEEAMQTSSGDEHDTQPATSAETPTPATPAQPPAPNPTPNPPQSGAAPTPARGATPPPDPGPVRRGNGHTR